MEPWLRPGFGAIVHRQWVQLDLRALFLIQLAKVAPRVFPTLRDRLLPEFAAVITACESGDYDYPSFRRKGPGDFSMVVYWGHTETDSAPTQDHSWAAAYWQEHPQRESVRRLWEHVGQWAAGWNLAGCGWVSLAALNMLEELYCHSSESTHTLDGYWFAYGSLLSDAALDSLRPNSAHRFTFEHEGWNMAQDSRAEAEAAMLEAYKRQVKEHHDTLEAAAAAAEDFVRTTRYPSLLDHLDD